MVAKRPKKARKRLHRRKNLRKKKPEKGVVLNWLSHKLNFGYTRPTSKRKIQHAKRKRQD